MKKGILIAIIMICMSNVSIAQNISSKGVKAGISFSDWYGKDADDFGDNFSYIMSDVGFTSFNLEKKVRYGFSLGAFLNFKVNEIFSIQPELIYIMKGVKFDGGGYFEGYYIDTQIIFKTNYIEIPLLAKLSTIEDNTINPFIIFGPSISFNTSSDLEVKVEFRGESESEVTEFDYFKDTDLNLILGGGFCTSNGILFDIRYNLGLVSIDDSNDQIQIKNRTITLMLGFQF